MDLGKDEPGNNRGSRALPSFAYNVLRGGPPGTTHRYVEISTARDGSMRFDLIEDSGGISQVKSVNAICEGEEWSFTRSSRDGSEGANGTLTVVTFLHLYDEGSLKVRSIETSVGKYFGVFGYHMKREFGYVFSRVQQ